MIYSVTEHQFVLQTLFQNYIWELNIDFRNGLKTTTLKKSGSIALTVVLVWLSSFRGQLCFVHNILCRLNSFIYLVNSLTLTLFRIQYCFTYIPSILGYPFRISIQFLLLKNIVPEIPVSDFSDDLYNERNWWIYKAIELNLFYSVLFGKHRILYHKIMGIIDLLLVLIILFGCTDRAELSCPLCPFFENKLLLLASVIFIVNV